MGGDEGGREGGRRTHTNASLALEYSQHRHDAVAARLRTSATASDFFDELASLLADGAPSASAPAPAPLASARRVAAVLASLPDAWLARVTCMSDDGARLTVAVPDSGAGKDRGVILTLPPAWPAAPPAVGGDAPSLPSRCVWRPGTTLGAVLDGVAAAFEAGAPVARLLADIDAHCRVLDPPLPPPAAATWRRLALAGVKASVEAAFDAAAGAEAAPELAFLGPPAAVDGPRATAATASWHPHLGGTAALEALLGVGLERRGVGGGTDATTPTATTDAECAVCYAYRLDGGPPPSIACANARCGRPFHAACLRGWLLQTAGEGGGGGGGALHGDCPYCGDGITLDEG